MTRAARRTTCVGLGLTLAAMGACAEAAPDEQVQELPGEAGGELGCHGSGAGCAEHVILVIGDGMHFASEVTASRYLYGVDDGLAFHHFPYRGSVATWDVTAYNKYAAQLGCAPFSPDSIVPRLGYDPERGGVVPYPMKGSPPEDAYFLRPGAEDSYATDSASAATAWATGYKTDDGNLSWLPGDPEGGALVTIAELLREQRGAAIGTVSTVPFTHATPAAPVSHNVNRNNFAAIGEEILREARPEVVISGGHPSWEPKYVAADLYRALKSGELPEYHFVERQASADGGAALLRAAEQAASEGRRLMGLFGGRRGHFEPPVARDAPGEPSVASATEENPTLAEAATAALTVLGREEDGFFLLVEQGDIDWANHDNDHRWRPGSRRRGDRALRGSARG